jgi:hypothetical protein
MCPAKKARAGRLCKSTGFKGNAGVGPPRGFQ